MWKKISDWWNKDKIELQKKVTDANAAFDQIQNTLFNLRTEHDKVVHELERLKAEHPDMKAEGVTTPWLIVGVNGESEVKGLKIFMDWNDAVIEHMKDKKLNYRTEEEMIQHFIAQLYEHVLMVLENKVIDQSDEHRPNEFE